MCIVRVAWPLFIFWEKNENTHSVHVKTKWWWKGVGLGEEELTKNYAKTSTCTSVGSGNNAKRCREISFLKLSGNPVLFWRRIPQSIVIVLTYFSNAFSRRRLAQTICWHAGCSGLACDAILWHWCSCVHYYLCVLFAHFDATLYSTVVHILYLELQLSTSFVHCSMIHLMTDLVVTRWCLLTRCKLITVVV